MASYYEQVQDAIRANEKEIAHLKEELRGLKSVERDTPRDSFQRQHAQILYHIDQEQKRLEENRALLETYHAARDAISELRESRESEDLDKLRAMLASERDPKVRREILEELEAAEIEHQQRIEAIEETVRTNMANLTDELNEELRQSFLVPQEKEAMVEEPEAVVEDANVGSGDGSDDSSTGTPTENANVENEAVIGAPATDNGAATNEENVLDISVEIPNTHNNRRDALQSDLAKAEEELAAAEQAMQDALARLKRIFDEESARMESGPFRTEEELSDVLSEYMRQKIEASEVLEASRARVSRAQRQVSRLETRLEEYATLQEQARGYEIEVEVLEQIREAVSRKEVLEEIYRQKGLGEVTRDTKEGKEQADRVTEEVVQGIVQKLREAGINTGNITQSDIIQSGALNVNQNGAINVNVIENVNLVVGSDRPVQEGPARVISMNPADIDTIKRTQEIRISIKIVPHNGNEQEGKIPGKAPEDMPKQYKLTPGYPRLPAGRGNSEEAGGDSSGAGDATDTPAEVSETEPRKVTGTEGSSTGSDEESGTSGTDGAAENEAEAKPSRTKYQLQADMNRISETLYDRHVSLEEEKRKLQEAIEAKKSDAEIEQQRKRVEKAQGEYDAQMDKLRAKQQAYAVEAADEKYNRVGTDKKARITISDEYIVTPDYIPGDMTTLRYVHADGDGKPELRQVYTGQSAKIDGQIDKRVFEKLLREKYGPVPKPDPVTPKPDPVTPEPDPVTPEPDPVTPSPDPVTPSPDPVTPSPDPVTPSPDPVTPSPDPVTPSPDPVTPEPEKEPRGLMTIIEEVTKGLKLKSKDGKRFNASNIKVFKGFKEELSSGNFLYNIVHLVPAIVKLPFNLIRKAVGKIMLGAESKRNIAELRKRIDKLSEEDLMTIYKEYRGNKVLQERFPTILNTLLEEKMQKFTLGKVTEINAELEARYQSAFSAMHQLDAINAELAKEGITDARRKELEAAKADVLSGQAANIATIRSRYIEANNWMSGGLHGFSEDMKAAATKLSLVGKRFAKDHDLNPELLARQAALERAEMKAIEDGDDEMALRVFIENELLLSKNTKIQGSIFGRRSTGEKYYSPLVEALDYRDDPFIRDLFTTIAVTSATISTIQSIKAAREQAAAIAENNRRMAQNNQTMQQVNQMGQDIASKRGTMMEGMESQGMQDTLTSANEIERAVLDKTGWGLGTKAYRTADNAGHSYYTTFYDSTKQAYENIAQQYASGQITQAQAMQQMADLGARTHQTFGAINTECLNILKPYAASHPQFSLSGVQSAMEYLQANPSAVQAMNQAMVDVTNAGDVLASMQLQQLIPLTTLPADIRAVIINGAATAALASNINNSMGARKHTYGNSVTEMVDEYSQQASASSSEKGNTSSR